MKLPTSVVNLTFTFAPHGNIVTCFPVELSGNCCRKQCNLEAPFCNPKIVDVDLSIYVNKLSVPPKYKIVGVNEGHVLCVQTYSFCYLCPHAKFQNNLFSPKLFCFPPNYFVCVKCLSLS